MEVYILDDQFRRTDVVENFESFVWTERYQDPGDFVLEIEPALAEASLSLQGTRIACDKSDRVMVVDTVENSLNDDGVRLLKITGPSLETIMYQRLNRYNEIASGAPAAPFTPTPGIPSVVMWNMFRDACITNSLVPADNIPNVQNGTISSTTGAIALPTDVVTTQIEIGSLYDTIKSLADTYGVGFRLIRVEDATPANPAKLYFEVYTGFDRTTQQTALDAIVFSVLLDNLTDTSELTSTEPFKNVCYIYGANGSAVVYEGQTDPSVAGFQRRALIVSATDIADAPGATLTAKLQQRAREELAKNQAVVGFDGKISATAKLVYGVNYKLGDLVEQRNEAGTRTVMKVTEQIFTSDKEGEKSYPTLTLNSLIVAGSWDAAPPTRNWDSYTTQTWDSM